MADPFLAQVILFAGNFNPRGWAYCDGQLLPIAQNTALFSLIGTIYGGDGESTFGLPDFRGRAPMHAGTGPGLSPRQLGVKDGAEKYVLTTNHLPQHAHAVGGNIRVSEEDANTPDSESHAIGGAVGGNIFVNDAPSAQMANGTFTGTLQNTGSANQVNNMMPYLAINFIIAIQGTFPSRN
jgi:microcystin-dependent protein